MHQRTAYLGRNVVLAAMLLIGCGDSGPDEDEPGTAGFTFVTITQDGKPWQAEASGFQMLGPGHASFGWQRQLAGSSQQEGVVLILRGFTGVGDYVLSEGSVESQASYSVREIGINAGLRFVTTGAHPGYARISGFDPADSTIAGNFRFELHFPDETKTSFAGVFRVRHPTCC
jgi:hypothetical protein